MQIARFFNRPLAGFASLGVASAFVQALAIALTLSACAKLPHAPMTQTSQTVEDSLEDPYLWLEDVQGDRALAWAR